MRRADQSLLVPTRKVFAVVICRNYFEEYELAWFCSKKDLTLASNYRRSVFVSGRRLRRRAESGVGIGGIQTRGRLVQHGGTLSLVRRGKDASRATEAVPKFLGDAAP